MDGGGDHLTGSNAAADARKRAQDHSLLADAHFPSAENHSVLVGRRDALRVFELALNGAAGGGFQFLSLVGEPGAGKTRLLAELAAAAGRKKLATLWGRAAEFEQEMPFAVVIDALDDYVEACGPGLPGRLGTEMTRTLALLFPSLRPKAPRLDPAAAPGEVSRVADVTRRYGLYRAVRQLLGELAAPRGLVLILDDVHWADEATIELLDHLVRHPPRGRVLVAVAYRPAQASAKLTALAKPAGSTRQVPVEPMSLAETEEFLGPAVSRRRCLSLHELSGGNPFYLEALARMDRRPEPAADQAGHGELPPAVRAALQVEVGGMSPAALVVAQGAAVAADEFDPALAAVAAEVTEDVALEALSEMAARDIVRPTAPAGRFRFRHPLVRREIGRAHV